MNKYEVLERKLRAILQYIPRLQLKNSSSMEHMEKYKTYIEKIICSVQTKQIHNSNGALLGLIQGISGYDEICKDKKFWDLVVEADKYYSTECVDFTL